MKKGEIKTMVLENLKDNGPMTIKELSECSKIPPCDLHGAIKSLAIDGKVYKYQKNRKEGNIWATYRT